MAANGLRALGLILSAQLVLGGCAQSETTRTVKSPVQERRRQVNASEPLLSSEWQVEGGRILGHVMWSSCVRERSWSVEEQRVEHVRPLPEAGIITGGAGLAAIITGLALRDTKPTTECTTVYSQRSDVPGFESCSTQQPENGGSDVAIVVGALALVTGAVLLGIKPSDKITVLKREPHAETSVSPCVAAEDLSIMILLVKLGPNRFVHVTVDAHGEASADLPANARLPKGADLEILVYRAPPVLAKALPRWTAIGHVHVPD